MTWINKVELDQPNDEHVLRGIWQILPTSITGSGGGTTDPGLIRVLQVSGTDPDSTGLRGIGRITAMQVVCEIGDFRRFEKPTALWPI